MKILTGIDIVDINDFKSSLKNGGNIFLNKIFTPTEQKNLKLEHLAGLFAAKEAVMKALSIPAGNWLKIEIINEPTGRPKVKVRQKITTFDLSISHSKNTAVAVFVAIL